jgi:hypothetical protein
MSWYSLDLLEGFEEHIDQAWQAAWNVTYSDAETASEPANAIFRKPRPGGGWTLFFPPSGDLLAETFGAKPCDTPSAAGMVLVAGNEGAMAEHFPGAKVARARRPGKEQPGDQFEPTQPLEQQ